MLNLKSIIKTQGKYSIKIDIPSGKKCSLEAHEE